MGIHVGHLYRVQQSPEGSEDVSLPVSGGGSGKQQHNDVLFPMIRKVRITKAM